MKINEIGGEFALIKRLTERLPQASEATVIGIGDDAAVLETAPAPAPYLLVTTDLLVENRHFRNHWATAEQIGQKAAECNLSDIAAMGGRPTWMFISLALRPDCKVRWVEKIYDGIVRSCNPYAVTVAGGDTTQADLNMINITLLGMADRSDLCLRSQAQPGDFLMTTGSLGASAAALALLEMGTSPGDYLLSKHLSPTCRLDVSNQIAPLANAMIDLSDGLGSDLRHVCAQSKVSAEIIANDIPIHPEVTRAAELLGKNPVDLALGGGEDFELLFSISPENMNRLLSLGLSCHPIGRIVPGSGQPVIIDTDGRKKPLVKGYDHFG